jgi:hypothetical protein
VSVSASDFARLSAPGSRLRSFAHEAQRRGLGSAAYNRGGSPHSWNPGKSARRQGVGSFALRQGHGVGDFGSTIPYAVSLQGIQGAADDGNISQAESLLAQLNGLLQNDLQNGVITDQAGLQSAFNATAAYIQQQVPYQSADAARWGAVVAQLQANVSALNSDVAYNASQGNLASTTAGAQAAAAMGTPVNQASNLLNVAAPIVGSGPSVVDTTKVGAALSQAVGPGGVASGIGDYLANLKTALIGLAVGGTVLVLGVAWAYGRGRGRSNPRARRFVPSHPRRRAA